MCFLLQRCYTFAIELFYCECCECCDRAFESLEAITTARKRKVAHETAKAVEVRQKGHLTVSHKATPLNNRGYAVQAGTSVWWRALEIFEQYINPIQENLLLLD